MLVKMMLRMKQRQKDAIISYSLKGFCMCALNLKCQSILVNRKVKPIADLKAGIFFFF